MNTRFKKSILTVLLASTIGLVGCASSTTTESTGEYLDDSVITTKVKSDLIGDKAIHSGNITVTTFKSVVQLSGFVNSPDQVLKAGQVASKVSGVVRVENDLIVK
ncbi:MAG: BON domain-containing protein [Gammaproteobacteria bacterium]|nr:BON domain-containing protein [Gammaproteobacteria bacterium]